jgi:transposase
MSTECTKLDFTNQDIYVGLDVSKKSWKVCIYVGMYFHRQFAQPPQPDVLVNYLRRNFPGARYHCVYEAGCFGFWIYETLNKHGIHCIVVNPADVPTTSWEKSRKTDRVDANKLARSLAAGELHPIYVPERKALEDRNLVRLRTSLVREQTRNKNRIKAMLQYYGITTPDGMEQRHWSRRYLAWIEAVAMQYESGNYTFRLLVGELISRRQTIADLTLKIRHLSREEPYRTQVDFLCTICGISQLAAMVFLTELIDIKRFKRLDHMASYAGLIPGEHSSGEQHIDTGLTYRRNPALRTVLIECAWIAVKRDPALLMCFNRYASRMPKNMAIVKIARKLLNRIRYVLKNQMPYQIRVVAMAE